MHSKQDNSPGKDPFQAIWLILPIMLCLITVWTANEFPRDFWLHVNHGRQMWTTGQFVTVDQFTHTIAGQPVLNHPWLTQLIFFGLFQVGGYSIVQFVAGLCYAAAIGLVGWVAAKRAGSIDKSNSMLLAGLLAIVAFGMTMSNLGVRPQAFSNLLFAIELALLWRCTNTKQLVVSIGLVQLLWSNMHGAFPLGIVLPAIFFAASVGERICSAVLRGNENGGIVSVKDEKTNADSQRTGIQFRYLWATLVAAIAILSTPQGINIVQYVVGVSSKASERQIEEWLPTAFDTFAGRAYWISLLPAFGLLAACRKRVRLVEWMLLIAFAVLAAKCQRMVAWWALIVPTVAAPHIATLLGLIRRKHSDGTRAAENSMVVNILATGALSLALIVSTPWTKQLNPLLPPAKKSVLAADEPLGAVQFLQQAGVSGRMYQPMEWGSYFSWSLDPELKVFVDTRIDFFPDEVWNDYVSAGTQERETIRVLRKYHIDVVVCDRLRARQLSATMQTLPGWQRVFDDDVSEIYLKKSLSTRPVGLK